MVPRRASRSPSRLSPPEQRGFSHALILTLSLSHSHSHSHSLTLTLSLSHSHSLTVQPDWSWPGRGARASSAPARLLPRGAKEVTFSFYLFLTLSLFSLSSRGENQWTWLSCARLSSSTHPEILTCADTFCPYISTSPIRKRPLP